MSIRRILRLPLPRAAGIAVVYALGLLAATPSLAQVASEGRGVLTIMFGRGSGPIGGVAEEVATQTTLPAVTQNSLGWRISGGYNFATYFSAEAAIGRIGVAKRSAAYTVTATTTDQLNTSTDLNLFEVNLIARLPLAERFRFDVTVGGAESSLSTTLSTGNGSSLPYGQPSPVHVRHFGYDAGLDAEWRLSDHVSLILGDHVYPNVGSNHVQGSHNGTFTILAGGVHIEF